MLSANMHVKDKVTKDDLETLKIMSTILPCLKIRDDAELDFITLMFTDSEKNTSTVFIDRDLRVQ